MTHYSFQPPPFSLAVHMHESIVTSLALIIAIMHRGLFATPMYYAIIAPTGI